MAEGAPDGSTFTIVLPDGPCEIGEMAPRGETCPVSASSSTVFIGASSSPFLPHAQFRLREFMTQPPPRANSTRGVVVRVQFALQQFTQLDTTNQRITFFAWWRHYWVDPRLAWNPDGALDVRPEHGLAEPGGQQPRAPRGPRDRARAGR